MSLRNRTIALVAASALMLSGCAKQAEKPAPQAEAEHHAEGEAHHDDPHEEGVVRLAAPIQRQIGLASAPLGTRSLATVLTTTGAIEANGNREAHVTTRVPGRVIALYKAVGDVVRAGEPLATLDSVELGQAQSAYLEAYARYELSRSTFDREQKLFQEQLIAQKEALAAENQLRLSEIDLQKAKSQLSLYGFTDARVRKLAATRRLDPTIPLLAPIGGVVLSRELTLGEVLEPRTEAPAFILTDVSQLWANANLFEKDLPLVYEGQQATIKTPAYPGKTYRGRVSLISTTLDKETRTAKARIVVDNADRKLKPDMFATIRIEVGAKEALALPAEAVTREKEQTFVFVRTEPEAFERRPVSVGDKVGEHYPVLEGLKAGEDVVVKGAFTLKSELQKESLSHDH